MIKFLLFDLSLVSHRIPRKNNNAVYCLQISALVPEISKFEKSAKYPDEMTDDVIHSAQHYIKYKNRPISVNLQHRPMKLSLAIIKIERPKWPEKTFNIEKVWNPVCCHGNTTKLLLWNTFSRILLQRIKYF